jgi:hypothetical protein
MEIEKVTKGTMLNTKEAELRLALLMPLKTEHLKR